MHLIVAPVESGALPSNFETWETPFGTGSFDISPNFEALQSHLHLHRLLGWTKGEAVLTARPLNEKSMLPIL